MENKADNQNKTAKTNYILFGIYLESLRKKRSLRTLQVAEFLEMTLDAYREFEDGKTLPDDKTMMKLARLLNEPLAKFKERTLHAQRQSGNESGLELKGAVSLADQLAKGIERVKQRYKESNEHELSQVQLRIFGALKRQLYRMFFVPILPFPTAIILDSVRRNRKKFTYLHEITNFVLQGETLAGFIARDSNLGPFLFNVANIFYFQDNPSTNLLDCMNRITIEQFEELFLLGVINSGVYTNELELSDLQQHYQFVSFGTLMARELKPHLPANINFNHLEMAILLQGVGHQALYTCLEPSTREDETPLTVGVDVAIDADPEMSISNTIYESLDKNLFNDIIYELHPVVSAMAAANWGYPKEVIDVLLTHHDDAEKVTPLCATLKLVNFFVDLDFPAMKEEELVDYLKFYPQINITPQALFSTLAKLNSDKLHFIAKSSTMASNSGRDVSKFFKEKMQGSKKKKEKETVVWSGPFSEKGEFFFNQDFLKATCIVCLSLVENIEADFLCAREKENMDQYLNRIKLFQLRLAYAKNRDLQSIAFKFNVSEDEIRNLLRLK